MEQGFVAEGKKRVKKMESVGGTIQLPGEFESCCQGPVSAAKVYRPEDFRQFDHFVCGSSKASRLFIDAATSPPFQGECCLIQFIHAFYDRALLLESTKYARS